MIKIHTSLFLLLSTLSCFAQDCGSINWESIADTGPYEVATLEEEADGLRDGPGYDGATLYYPLDAPTPLASIAIVPGFLANPSSIEDWGPFYASHGILTMIIGTNSLSENPESRANGLIDALETLRQENNRAGSPLNGLIDTLRFAVSGWSMGGGGAQRAAVLDSNSIKTVVALCPWLPQAELDHPVPVLIFGGQLDAVAPPSAHASAHYNTTPETTDKLKYIVNNGGHQVANDPEGGDGDVGKMALSWLRYYLLDDPCYCPLLLEEPTSASDYVTNVVCETVSSTPQHFDHQEEVALIFPNPTSNYITIVAVSSKARSFELYNLLGERMKVGIISSQQPQIDLSQLPAAMYFLRLGKQTYKVRKI